tara:strand:- start:990 stop:1118 length:129 start_codon:yes stop_codon:yes gene_type:complete
MAAKFLSYFNPEASACIDFIKWNVFSKKKENSLNNEPYFCLK